MVKINKNLLNKYDKIGKLDLHFILEFFGIKEIVITYDNLKERKALGETHFIEDKPMFILIDKSIEGEQFLEVLAHELSHCINGYSIGHSYEFRKYRDKLYKLMKIGKY